MENSCEESFIAHQENMRKKNKLHFSVFFPKWNAWQHPQKEKEYTSNMKENYIKDLIISKLPGFFFFFFF